jgi:hypothetical protein
VEPRKDLRKPIAYFLPRCPSTEPGASALCLTHPTTYNRAIPFALALSISVGLAAVSFDEAWCVGASLDTPYNRTIPFALALSRSTTDGQTLPEIPRMSRRTLIISQAEAGTSVGPIVANGQPSPLKSVRRKVVTG